LLGIVFDSNLFPEHNGDYLTRLSIMMGGTRCPDMLTFCDDVIKAYVKEYLHKYLNITCPADYLSINLAPQAISRYPVGHYRTIHTLAKEKRRLTLIGSGLYGVSVGESITSAYNSSLQLF